ncbi:MAG: molybdopterin-dependent oxidoreductase [Bacillota bacterium]
MAELVTLTIDGREVTVPKGTTVLYAAKAAGIQIPHLCYCSGLKGTGACRICLVEIEKVKGLVVSCLRKVAPEMVVRTNTDQIREARRFIIELLLSRHPGLCLSCDKSGDCRLQQYAYELGIERPSFPVRDPGYAVDESNPFIVRNYNLCILCGRCIRVCRVQGADILDFMKRGIETKVATALDKPLQEAGCDFCGSCVGVCPTGALLEKSRRGKGREWEFQAVKSHCGYCSSACEMYFNLKQGEIVKVTTGAPVDYLCVRGRFGYGYLTSDRRLTTPLVRKEGELVPASWEEALEVAASSLRKLRDRHGPQSVGGIAGASVNSETAYAFQKFIRAGLKTNNVDTGLRFTGLNLLRECDAIIGGQKGYALLDDISDAGVLLVIGDVSRRVPAVWGRIKRAADRGAKVVYLGFYNGRPARVAKAWLRALPGTEHLVLQQLAAAVLKLTGDTHVEKLQVGKFGTFKKGLRAAARAATGVAAEEITAAAEIWADKKAKGVVVLAVDGVTEETGRAALNLCLLTGRVKNAVFLGHSSVNAQGVWRMGAVTETFPGFQAVPRAAGKFSRLWGAELSETPGLTAGEMLAESSPVKGLYILGEDPAVSFPDCGRIARRLEKLDFLVVQDLFLTETAGMADVVLPLSVAAETGGAFINAECKVRQAGKVLPEKTFSAVQVIGQLMSKLNGGLGPYRHLRDEILTIIPNFGAKSSTPSRLAFLPVEVAEPEAEQEGALRLVAFASRFGGYNNSWNYHSGIQGLCPYGGDFVAVSPADADRLGLTEGAAVTVRTAQGRINTSLRIDPSLPEGVATMPAYTAKTNTVLKPGAPNEPVTAEVSKL